MIVVMAHAGHWLPQLLYLAPLVVLVVAIVVGRVRERREGRAGDREDI
jgi:cytochrome c oxidase assembly factor CtaG